MALPDVFLQELKARSDIAEVASSYVPLKRTGRSLVGLCPFHSEKTPSLHVYPENGSFYCFGCGVGGDIITFVRRIENLDYMEAVRFLAQRVGIPVPESQVDDTMAKLRARILEINRESARYFYTMLRSEAGAQGLDYLRGRGLAHATITHFGLGFAPPSRFALVDHLRQKGYRPEEMVQANVAYRGRNGGVADRFYGRVMFPILDLRGNVIAFGGRILTQDKPKYLNTSDTPVFHKSGMLFALNFAKNTNASQLILAEGYMDVISLHQAGFPQAVATLGTALTSEQARLLAKYAKEVVLCYDSDEAGQKAAARAIPILREAGLMVKVLSIVGGKDPDEYIKSFGEQGHARFQQLLDTCGNDVEYRLQKIQAGLNLQNAEGRISYLTAAAEVLSTLDSRIEQEVYAGRLAEETGVDRATVLRQVEKNADKRRKTQRKKEFREYQQRTVGIRDTINPDKAKNLRAASAEEALIGFLCRYPENISAIATKLPPEKFLTAFNRRVYETIVGRMKEGKGVSLTELSGEFSIDEVSAIARMIANHQEVTATERDAEEYIQVISQERERQDIASGVLADPQEIQKHLQRLREQKK